MIKRGAIVLLFAGIVLLALAFSRSAHAGDYPTAQELEAICGYSPGMPIKEFRWHGRSVQVSYVRGRRVGNGEYDVRIRLR